MNTTFRSRMVDQAGPGEPVRYSTALEGGQPVCRRYAIRGSLCPSSFAAFVAGRAAWFGISGWIGADGEGLELVAAGPEALVGALEMAVTLGPLDALVDVAERDATTPAFDATAAGFEVRL